MLAVQAPSTTTIDATQKYCNILRMMMKALHSFFSGGPQKREAQEVYIALVNESRKAFFYTECDVPDTLDGRFDVIVLHIWLELARLKANQKIGDTGKQGDEKKIYRLSRALIEALFDDMDRSLREMGVGDMGVGKRVKQMSKAAYGRLEAYSQAAASAEAMAEALKRNIYRGAEVRPEALAKLREYAQTRNGAPVSGSAGQYLTQA
jgi:cytochrome b pre-mRNA-processing protein 3